MKRILLILASLAFASVATSEAQTSSELPSWAIGSFVRADASKPFIEPCTKSTFKCPMKNEKVHWECADTFNPAAAVKDGKICVLYRSEDNPVAGIGGRTSRLGYVETKDGVNIQKRSKKPVFYPDGTEISKVYEWQGGCEDPRIAVTEDGMYVMMYTSWNYDTPRLSVATSRDLKHWTKHGPAFADAYNGRFIDDACKSGSIVTTVKDGRLVIAKVNGHYLMYWGESFVAAATSDDLVHWTPVLGKDGELLQLIVPRKGYFDSSLTECGPPAVITKDGIVLMYNGKNSTEDDECDPRFNRGTYSAGQVLFSLSDPYKAIARLDVPFFKPEAAFEKSGQYVQGTVFIEGLAYLNQDWYLYYGCADSKVGVAICRHK